MIDLLLTCSLYGAAAAVASITSREFGLYNLAIGPWIIVGGWFALWVSGAEGAKVVNPEWFLVVLVVGLLQVLAPMLLRERIKEHPLAYLFVTLGVALVLVGLISSYVLDSSVAFIGEEWDTTSVLWFVAAVAISVGGISWGHTRASWARMALRYRIGEANYRALAVLVAIELVVLVVIGGVSLPLHRGLVSSAELYTVIPILAVVASRGRPTASFLVGFLISVLAHGLILLGPTLGVGQVASYAAPIAIVLLITILLWSKRGPGSSLMRAPAPGHVAPRRPSRWYLTRPSGLRSTLADLRVAGFLAVALIVVLAVWQLNVPASMSTERVHYFAFVSAMLTVAWVGQANLGVLSIAWPTLFGAAGYVVALLGDRGVLVAGVLVCMSLAAAFYLWKLRLLEADEALVIDLAAVAAIHHTVVTSSAIVGVDKIQMFSSSTRLDWPLIDLGTQVAVVVWCIALVSWLSCSRRGRGLSLGLLHFQAGQRHGLRVRSAFVVVAVLLVGASFVSGWVHFAERGSISPEIMSLSEGLVVLLLAYLSQRAGLAWGIGAAFVLFGVLGSVTAGQGLFSSVIVGLGLFIIPWVLTTPRGPTPEPVAPDGAHTRPGTPEPAYS